MLHRFQTLEEIGHGAMARVYKGVDRANGETFAIKVLNDTDETFLGSFLREVQVTARLRHENIISIYDFGRIEERHTFDGLLRPGLGYFVSNFVEGGPLQPAQSFRNWSGLLQFTSALLRGLAHAHARGVVHRDLKPANILVRDVDRPRPVIADFGVAHDLARTDEDQTLEIAGTPLFMAPEQFVDFRHVGPWSDLYSVGCILWFACTGKYLFDYSTTTAIAFAHYSEQVGEFDPRFPVPEGFEAVLRKALEKSSDDRYKFAAEFSEALAGLPALHDQTPDHANFLAPDEPTYVLNDAVTEVVPRFEHLPVPHHQSSKLRQPIDWKRVVPDELNENEPIASVELFGLRETTFVGRTDETNSMIDALKRVCERKTNDAILITGRDGVGKTRLATRFCRLAHEHGLAQSWTSAARYGDDIFDCLWRILKRELQCLNTPSATIRTILEQRFPGLSSSIIGPLAGELGDDGADVTAPVERFTSSTKRLQAFSEVVSEFARDRALIIRIDDLEHTAGWRSVLEYFVGNDWGNVLMLFTSDGTGADFFATHSLGTLKLEPLSTDEFTRAIRSDLKISPSTFTALERLTAPDLGFAYKTLNHWIRSGLLSIQNDAWHVEEIPQIETEPMLNTAVVRRVRAELHDEKNRAITIGAALGFVVDADDWLDVCARLDCVGSAELLSEFDREGVIEIRRDGWAFRSRGIRDAFLETVSASTRERFHRACIESIRRNYRPNARGVSERIAQHYAQIGDNEAARSELLEELRRTANDADVEYCFKLLDLRDALPRRETTDDDIEAMLLRAQFLIPAGDSERAIDVLNRAQSLSDPSRAIYADVVRSKGVLLRNLGHYSLAIDALEEATDRFEAMGDTFNTARSLLGQLTVLRYLGRMPEAIERAQRSIELFEDRSWQMIAEREYGRLLFQSGRTIEARDYLLELLQTFRTEGLRYIETELLMDIGAVYQELAEYEQATQYFEQAWDAMRDNNDVNLNKAIVQMAQTAALAGEIDACIAHTKRALREILTPIMRGYLAEVQILAAALQSNGLLPGDWRASMNEFAALQKERAIVNVEIARAATWASQFSTVPELTETTEEIANRMWAMLRE